MAPTTSVSNDFVTRRQAANSLGTTERTIFNRIRSGALRRSIANGEHGVRKSDVIELASIAQAHRRSSRRVARLLVERSRRIEVAVQAAIDILDLSRQSLALAAEELVELYRCAEAFSTGGWPLGCEHTWAEFFLRLDLNALGAIADAAVVRHPWRPFVRLHMRMIATADSKNVLALRAAETHLRKLAVRWIEREQGPRASHQTVRKLGGLPNRQLVRRRRADPKKK